MTTTNPTAAEITAARANARTFSNARTTAAKNTTAIRVPGRTLAEVLANARAIVNAR